MPIVEGTADACFRVFADHIGPLISSTVTSRYPAMILGRGSRRQFNVRNPGAGHTVPLESATHGRVYLYLGQELEACERGDRRFQLHTCAYWYKVFCNDPAMRNEPAFRCEYEATPPAGKNWECGHSGWVALQADMGASSRLDCDYSAIATASVHRTEDVRYLHTDSHVSDEPDSPLNAVYFNRKTRTLDAKPAADADQLRVYVHTSLSQGTPRRDLQRCPACDALGGLTFLASRSASLASVCVGHLYTTPLNTDRKLLAFSDSVQDASHRAGFFSGRTYRFSIRSAMLAVVPEQGELPLSELSAAMIAYWSEHRSAGETLEPEAAMIAAFLPHDLEYLPEYQDYVLSLAHRFQRDNEAQERGEELGDATPAPLAGLMHKLRERMRWEAVRELGLAGRIGRTLERSGCASVTFDEKRFEAARDRITESVGERLGVANDLGEAAWRQFLVGLLRACGSAAASTTICWTST